MQTITLRAAAPLAALLPGRASAAGLTEIPGRISLGNSGGITGEIG